MPFKNKVKGSNFERLTVEILTQLVEESEWKRIPGSGMLGTSLNEPLLTSDVSGKVNSISKKFKVECKTGYGGATQFGLKKEWLDKTKMEADASYAIPILMGKFANAKDGVKVFVAMDVEIFASLLNQITKLKRELDSVTTV